ncbi:Glycosyl transferase [Plasmodiophora brassicae]
MSEVIVSLVTSDDFIVGAQVLAHSLRRVNVSVPLWLLVVPEVSERARDALASSGFDRVVVVDPIPNPNPSHVASWVTCGFTKLRIWQLDMLGVGRVLYIDADCVVLKNPEHLFDRLDRVDLAAAPDLFPPDNFNAGVLLIRPCSATFDRLLRNAPAVKSYDGGDTGYLNAMYPEWYTMDSAARLPFGCNAQRTMRVFTRKCPNYWSDTVDLCILHYSSSPKPWQIDVAYDPDEPVSVNDHPDVIFAKLRRSCSTVPKRNLDVVRLETPFRDEAGHAAWLPATFDEGMALHLISFGLYSSDDEAWLSKFRTAYARIRDERPAGSIPQRIHQIWLGDLKGAPADMRRRASRIRDLHPDWDYRLWTDDDVIDMEMRRRDLFDAADTAVGRADVLRWEIMFQYGGVYLDVDFDVLSPLDDLVTRYSAFVGFGSTGHVEIMNSVIGCTPRLSFASDVLDAMTSTNRDRSATALMDATGPGMLTRFCGNELDLGRMVRESIVVLPSAVLFPLPNTMRALCDADKRRFRTQYSFAMHHWSASWQRSPPEPSPPTRFDDVIRNIVDKRAPPSNLRDIHAAISKFI